MALGSSLKNDGDTSSEPAIRSTVGTNTKLGASIRQGPLHFGRSRGAASPGRSFLFLLKCFPRLAGLSSALPSRRSPPPTPSCSASPRPVCTHAASHTLSSLSALLRVQGSGTPITGHSFIRKRGEGRVVAFGTGCRRTLGFESCSATVGPTPSTEASVFTWVGKGLGQGSLRFSMRSYGQLLPLSLKTPAPQLLLRIQASSHPELSCSQLENCTCWDTPSSLQPLPLEIGPCHMHPVNCTQNIFPGAPVPTSAGNLKNSRGPA